MEFGKNEKLRIAQTSDNLDVSPRDKQYSEIKRAFKF
jgi:hypothetical protein